MQRRVVITGLGIVSPLGVGVGRNWKMLMDARTAVRYLPPELWEPFGLPVKIGALVPRGPQAEGCFDPDSLKTSSVSINDTSHLQREHQNAEAHVRFYAVRSVCG